ncbi:hypothetical protein [Cereibacter sphaeroides]|uniref:hypothetical protein n=1 Tax=Cereibacter sphaeroides TaxID=1063 RepID=UPI0011C452C2|nr:hypothetical protein [Cereibacter sphaeroides]
MPRYSLEQLQAAFAAKLPATPCAACGQLDKGYTLPVDEDGATSMLISTFFGPDSDAKIIGGKSLAHVPLICNNCGHTRIFNIQMLLRDV